MNKWEYCLVGPFGPSLEPLSKRLSIGTITANGVKYETFPGDASSDLASKLIAYLGSQGWELTTTGSFDMHPGALQGFFSGPVAQRINGHVLYFKRLLNN